MGQKRARTGMVCGQTSESGLGPGGPPYPYLPLCFTKIMEFLKIGSAISTPNWRISEISRNSTFTGIRARASGSGPTRQNLRPDLRIWARAGGPEVGQKWTRSGPEVGQKWTRSGPEVGQKWARSGPEVCQKWTRSGPEVGQNRARSVPEVGQNRAQNDTMAGRGPTTI